MQQHVSMTEHHIKFLLIVVASLWCGAYGLSWSAVSTNYQAPTGRGYAAAAADASTFYVAGGFSHAYQSCMDDLWKLDITSDALNAGTVTWSQAAGGPLPTGPIMGHTLTLFYGSPACSPAGCLLLIGGTQQCSQLGKTADATAWNNNTMLWEYNLGTGGGQWVARPVSSLPPLAFHTTIVAVNAAEQVAGQQGVVQQSLWVIGGLNASLQAQAIVYNISWSTAAGQYQVQQHSRLPTAVFGHSAVIASDSQDPAVWVVGGLHAWPAAGKALEAGLHQVSDKLATQLLRWTMGNNTWDTVSTIPPKFRTAFQSTWVVQDSIATFGGFGNEQTATYSIAKAAWSTDSITTQQLTYLGNAAPPPITVAAAVVDVGSQAMGPNTTLASNTSNLFMFGGWQRPEQQSVQLDSWTVIDEESTWMWGQLAETAGWQLVSYGAPSWRQDAALVAILVSWVDPRSPINPILWSRVLMYGGRVPGVVPAGSSSIQLQMDDSLTAGGGAMGVNTTDWATSYTYSDWWLLDPSGGNSPIRLRELIDDSNTVQGFKPGGGLGLTPKGSARVVWEQQLFEVLAFPSAIMTEVVEVDDVLSTNILYVTVELDNGLPCLVIQSIPDPQATTTACGPRLGATLAGPLIAYESQPCDQGNCGPGSPCRPNNSCRDFKLHYFVLHGGLRLQPMKGTNGTLQVSVTGGTCVFDNWAGAWLPPPSDNVLVVIPEPRYRHSCQVGQYDDNSYSMVCYGGLDASNSVLSDTSIFAIEATSTIGNTTSHSGSWQRLVDGDQTPGPRYDVAAFTMRWLNQMGASDTAGTFVMVGGRAGTTAATSTQRGADMWLLSINCTSTDINGASRRVATWMQVMAADMPRPALPSTQLTVIVSYAFTIIAMTQPTPIAPNRSMIPSTPNGAPMHGRVHVLDWGSCATSVTPTCSAVSNTYRWTVMPDATSPSACWSAAHRIEVPIHVNGTSPVSLTSFQAHDDVATLYLSTLNARVRDAHGASIMTEATIMPGRVTPGQDGRPLLTYQLPTLLVPPQSAPQQLVLDITTYGLVLASAPMLVSTTAVAKGSMAPVIMDFPSMQTVPVQATSKAASRGHRRLSQQQDKPPTNFEVRILTPDGRVLPRACIPNSGFNAVTDADIQKCYQVPADSMGAATLSVLLPTATAATTTSSSSVAALSGSGQSVQPANIANPAVYQFAATRGPTNSDPALLGTVNLTASELQSMASQGTSSPKTQQASTSMVGRALDIGMDVAPIPPPIATTIIIQFVSTPSQLNPPSGAWHLMLRNPASLKPGNGIACQGNGTYRVNNRLVCDRRQSLVPGTTYPAVLTDATDPNVVLFNGTVTAAMDGIRLQVEMEPVTVAVYFKGLATFTGSDSVPVQEPAEGAQLTIHTTPAKSTWDTGNTSQDGTATFALLPPSPSTVALGFTADVSLPGLPGELLPPTTSLPRQMDQGDNQPVEIQVPAFLLCESGNGLPTLLTEPIGSFPLQPVDTVVYAPGSTCSWLLMNTGDTLTVQIGYSLLAPGDVLRVTRSTAQGADVLSMGEDASGTRTYQVNGNLTIALVSSSTAGVWGRGFTLAWTTSSRSSSRLPTQLIMLIVSTVSAGGAMLVFVLLWHFCYRPTMQARRGQDATGPRGAPQIIDRTHHHVPRRILRLLPIIEYQAGSAGVDTGKEAQHNGMEQKSRMLKQGGMQAATVQQNDMQQGAMQGNAMQQGDVHQGALQSDAMQQGDGQQGGIQPGTIRQEGATSQGAMQSGAMQPGTLSKAATMHVSSAIAADTRCQEDVPMNTHVHDASSKSVMQQQQQGVQQGLRPAAAAAASSNQGEPAPNSQLALQGLHGGAAMRPVGSQQAGIEAVHHGEDSSHIMIISNDPAVALQQPSDDGGLHQGAAVGVAVTGGSHGSSTAQQSSSSAQQSSEVQVAAHDSSGSEAPDNGITEVGASGLQSTPLTNSTLTAVSTAQPSQQTDSETNTDCCAICLVEYSGGDKLRQLPCQHMFHVACIDQWLSRDVACPLCKGDVVEMCAASTDANIASTATTILRKRQEAAAARRAAAQAAFQRQRPRGPNGVELTQIVVSGPSVLTEPSEERLIDLQEFLRQMQLNSSFWMAYYRDDGDEEDDTIPMTQAEMQQAASMSLAAFMAPRGAQQQHTASAARASSSPAPLALGSANTQAENLPPAARFSTLARSAIASLPLLRGGSTASRVLHATTRPSSESIPEHVVHGRTRQSTEPQQVNGRSRLSFEPQQANGSRVGEPAGRVGSTVAAQGGTSNELRVGEVTAPTSVGEVVAPTPATASPFSANQAAASPFSASQAAATSPIASQRAASEPADAATQTAKPSPAAPQPVGGVHVGTGNAVHVTQQPTPFLAAAIDPARNNTEPAP